MTKPILTKDAKPASDITAHSSRISAYSQFAARDINSILDDELADFPKDKEFSILDIGCGNGKQSLYLSQKFPNAKITAIDISEDAIKQLREKQTSIRTFVCDLNDTKRFQEILNNSGPVFDVIISFYALYYINDIETILPILKSAIKTDGKIILTGFSKLNNKELLELSGKYAQQSIETEDFLVRWMIEKHFGKHIYKTFYFHNPLQFPTVESFLEYYRNYGLYLKEIESLIAGDVQNIILKNGQFTLSKISLVVSIRGQHENESMTTLPAPLKTDVFSSRKYKELIKRIIEMEYEVHPICELKTHIQNQQNKFMLLRHDVDLTPSDAYKMAEAEAEAGIRSTYYFLISGGYFNILEKECRTCLIAISKMGHEVGVHFDDPATIQQDCNIIYDLIGKKILSLSQHNPTINGLKSIENANLINAYDKDILDKFGFTYVSDSGMKWREKTIFDLLGKQRLYFLAHPETWYSEGCDLIELHRRIEQHEINKLKLNYNTYVSGNIEYLRKRAITEDK